MKKEKKDYHWYFKSCKPDYDSDYWEKSVCKRCIYFHEPDMCFNGDLKRDAFCKKKQECKCITFFQSKIEEHSGKKS